MDFLRSAEGRTQPYKSRNEPRQVPRATNLAIAHLSLVRVNWSYGHLSLRSLFRARKRNHSSILVAGLHAGILTGRAKWPAPSWPSYCRAKLTFTPPASRPTRISDDTEYPDLFQNL